MVPALIDPEIKYAAGRTFHICRPLAEGLYTWIRFEKYPGVLRITRKQRQSPSKFGAVHLDTPLPPAPLNFYSLGVFKRHEA
jgi:hypothetical protein